MTPLCRRLAAILLLILLPSALSVAQQRADRFEEVLAAVVGVEARIPPEARTADALGTERSGSGVVIGFDGLIVTIGYLILEADQVNVLLSDGSRLPAQIVAYDHNGGFGLLRPGVELNIKPVRLGRSAVLGEEDRVLIVPHGGGEAVQPAFVVSRRTFAGYWEYLLEDAIFTSPPHPEFSGAALVGPDGALLGIGSLVVGDALTGERVFPGNMFVPVDLLTAELDELLARGRSPARPWLGVHTEEHRGHVFINRVIDDSPAQRAGLAENEIITAVAGQTVTDMAELFRRLWQAGQPGDEIPVTVLRDGRLVEVPVVSADRYDWLRLGPGP